MLEALFDATLVIDDSRQDLGSAEVDADDAFPVQTARLPYWLDGDGREALPRLPGRPREGQGSPGTAPGAAGAGRTGATTPEDPEAETAVELEAADRPGTPLPLRARCDLGCRG